MTNLMRSGDIQARYLAEAVETATPAVRLGMLWERLELLLHLADNAFENSEFYIINDSLIQAQDILLGLADTLRTDRWEAAGQLAALYRFLQSELVVVNVDKNRDRLRAVADMVAQLAAAWRTAIVTSNCGEERIDGVA